MSDDDDWFERALRDDEDDEAGNADGTADVDEADEAGNVAETSDATGSEADAQSDSGFSAFESDAGSDAPESSGFGDASGTGPSDASGTGFADGEEFETNDDEGFGTNDDGGGGADDSGFGTGDAGVGAAGDAAEESPAGASDPPPSAGDSSSDSTSRTDSSSGGFADADPYDADEQGSSSGRSESDDGDDLFDEDFASAFESAPGGGVGSGSPTPGGDGSADEFGGGSGEAGFGGGEFGDSGAGFGAGDEAFGGGFGDAGESFEADFDDEEFESSIPRIDLGIEGLDSMIQGGVPERSLITTIGSAGTGKTTFGLQFLHEALQEGENAVFITLEESRDRIVDTATEKGWDFEAYVEEGSLAVVDLDPIEMANSLTSIRNDLPRLVEEFDATRLVLDSVSLLEMMYDDQATRRNEVYDFTKSLKEAGVTTMLTSEASEDTPYASRHGIIEYLVDAVFVLRYIRSSDDFRETRLAVEIQKIRDANHSREIKPYAITNEGISVYRQANIF